MMEQSDNTVVKEPKNPSTDTWKFQHPSRIPTHAWFTHRESGLWSLRRLGRVDGTADQKASS